MKLRTIIILIIATLISCNYNSTKLIENKESNMILVDFLISGNSIDLDSFNLNNYPMQTQLSEKDGDYIIGYNYKLHCLDIFNLTQKKVASISLFDDGSNSINRDINGIFLNSLDSIWLYTTNTVYLLDKKGTVNKKLFIPLEGNEYIINTSNYSNATVKLHYNLYNKSLYYVTIKKDLHDSFYINELSVDSGLVVKRIQLESSESQNIHSKYGWMQHPNVTYNKSLAIFNFPYSSNIYTLNLETGDTKSYGGKSSFTSNLAKTIDNKMSFEHWNRHLIENIHFYEINYDHFRNCYYRIHVNGVEYSTKASLAALLNTKSLYLTVFDEQFHIIKELVLSQNSYNLIGGWGVIKEGFFLIKDNNENKQTNFEQLQYDTISFILK